MTYHLHHRVFSAKETICSQLLDKALPGVSCDCSISDGEVRWRRGEGVRRKNIELTCRPAKHALDFSSAVAD